MRANETAMALLLRALDGLLSAGRDVQAWLRHALDGAGVSRGTQTIILIAVALGVLVLRAAGGVLRVLLAVVVVLVLARAAGLLS